MAAFGAILDDKLNASPPVIAWSWRPAAIPFLNTYDAADPLGRRAYAGVAAAPRRAGEGTRLATDDAGPRAADQEPPRHDSARPPGPEPVTVARRLTPVQSAAIAVIRHLGATDLSDAFSAEDLKRAFRRLARQFHPDHASTADGAKFRDLHAAYQILRIVK